MTEELKGCRWCKGKEIEITCAGMLERGLGVWSFCCQNVVCAIAVAIPAASEEEAIQAWNTREDSV